ncbi:MAG: peptide chain release factor N(5)-glutamine methyltransferase [Alphaproteobacteria bacterium]|nr:peptide chain release factor N(5)-glutamine methyltransferase [Alphaproteobacteria bacterium]
MSDAAPSPKISDVINWAHEKLNQAKIDAPKREAEILLGEIIGVPSRGLNFRLGETHLTAQHYQKFCDWLARRCRHEPVSRIIGRREFWSLDFALSPATLDPRPDSEILVEAALKQGGGDFDGMILDLGTGSGCLLLALLSEWQRARGIGLDKNPDAIIMARHNAVNLGLAARTEFIADDWMDFNLSQSKKAELVIANPPYIPQDHISSLAMELAFDPIMALVGGRDGLECYRQILSRIGDFLHPSGKLLLEIGYDQALSVQHLMMKAGLAVIEKRQDLGGRDRVLVAKMAGN